MAPCRERRLTRARQDIRRAARPRPRARRRSGRRAAWWRCARPRRRRSRAGAAGAGWRRCCRRPHPCRARGRPRSRAARSATARSGLVGDSSQSSPPIPEAGRAPPDGRPGLPAISAQAWSVAAVSATSTVRNRSRPRPATSLRKRRVPVVGVAGRRRPGPERAGTPARPRSPPSPRRTPGPDPLPGRRAPPRAPPRSGSRPARRSASPPWWNVELRTTGGFNGPPGSAGGRPR